MDHVGNTLALCDGRAFIGEMERAEHIATFHPGRVLAMLDVIEALRFYADEETWTQPTSWGGRIVDDEGPWLGDTGAIARLALARLDALEER